MITHAEPEQGRAGYCWVILAVAFVLTFMTLGMRSTLGVFFKAMVDDLGWGRGTLSMVAAVNIWLGGLLFWRHDLALYTFAVSALSSEVYGTRALGTLNGIALLVHQIGAVASVWLAGVLHDTTGSYDFAFGLGLVALIGASLVSFGIAERRYSSRYAAV